MSLKGQRQYHNGSSNALAQTYSLRHDLNYSHYLVHNQHWCGTNGLKRSKTRILVEYSSTLSIAAHTSPSKDIYFDNVLNPFEIISDSSVSPGVSSSTPTSILQEAASGSDVCDFSIKPLNNSVDYYCERQYLNAPLIMDNLPLFSAKDILIDDEELNEKSWVGKLKAVSDSIRIETIRCGEQLDTEFLRDPVLLLEEPHCICAA